MVVDDSESDAIQAFAGNLPVGPPIVPTAIIMAQLDDHLNLEPVEFAFPGAALCVVSPVEPFDHAPLRARDRTIRPRDYLRWRRTVCKMPPLLM